MRPTRTRAPEPPAHHFVCLNLPHPFELSRFRLAQKR